MVPSARVRRIIVVEELLIVIAHYSTYAVLELKYQAQAGISKIWGR